MTDSPPKAARLAVFTIFFVNGATIASWVPHIPLVAHPPRTGEVRAVRRAARARTFGRRGRCGLFADAFGLAYRPLRQPRRNVRVHGGLLLGATPTRTCADVYAARPRARFFRAL